jgi:hypothetical protein
MPSQHMLHHDIFSFLQTTTIWWTGEILKGWQQCKICGFCFERKHIHTTLIPFGDYYNMGQNEQKSAEFLNRLLYYIKISSTR